jgi:hypothetical protein
LSRTLSRTRVPRFDEANHEVAIGFQTLFLGSNPWPESEEPADRLFVLSLSRGLELNSESIEENATKLLEKLRRR